MRAGLGNNHIDANARLCRLEQMNVLTILQNIWWLIILIGVIGAHQTGWI